ncbi:hypothetical protein Athai_24900 [Actinocatenispora thailandica]|uniref:Uncharacterized protein n=1 Tax=Actinocatenispora thailandica TaxID=227318 RepID=A0A7R7HWE1_9ACTN|nr:hypothetical protein Athai_24900 [Actinocatenispora thailandica]
MATSRIGALAAGRPRTASSSHPARHTTAIPTAIPTLAAGMVRDGTGTHRHRVSRPRVEPVATRPSLE